MINHNRTINLDEKKRRIRWIEHVATNLTERRMGFFKVYHKGEVYYCDFGVGVGTEQENCRPALILSEHDTKNNSKCLVAPITSNITREDEPETISIRHGKVYGMILLNDIRSVDKRRLNKNRYDKIPKEKMADVDEFLQSAFGLSTAIDELESENAMLYAENRRLYDLFNDCLNDLISLTDFINEIFNTFDSENPDLVMEELQSMIINSKGGECISVTSDDSIPVKADFGELPITTEELKLLIDDCEHILDDRYQTAIKRLDTNKVHSGQMTAENLWDTIVPADALSIASDYGNPSYEQAIFANLQNLHDNLDTDFGKECCDEWISLVSDRFIYMGMIDDYSPMDLKQEFIKIYLIDMKEKTVVDSHRKKKAKTKRLG